MSPMTLEMAEQAEEITGVRVPMTLAAPVTSPASTWRNCTIGDSKW